MQLRLAFLNLSDPPPSSTTTNPPTTPWQQIDESAQLAALEVLTKLIARMLAAQGPREMPHE